MNDLVSVIIPTHGRYDSLFRAIDSVLYQTYKNIEIIVVDDNYDNLNLREKIKKNILKNYNNIRIISKSMHLGGALARNLGFDNSKGAYIAFLDDDDEYYNEKIEKQLKLFKENKDKKLGLVYCYGDIIYPNGKIEKELTNYKGNPLAIQMMYNIAGTSFMMIKRDVFKKIGGFKKIYSHQDGVVILNLLANGFNIDLCEEILVKYYFHSKNNGITSVNENILKADIEYFDLCKNYFNLISKRDQKKVILNFYNDRNWNLIILNKRKEAIRDVKIIFLNYFINKYLFICIFRILFYRIYQKKEEKFDKEVLMEVENGEKRV